MKQSFLSHRAPLTRRGYRIVLLGLIVAAVLIPTSTWLLTPATAHAATGLYPTWCQNWDPNPANTSGKQIAPNTYKVLFDESVFEIDVGYYNGVLYEWANESYGIPGDQIALQWTWVNGATYQCGDSHGYDMATVWSGTTDTWTSGVPYYQATGERILFSPAGSSN